MGKPYFIKSGPKAGRAIEHLIWFLDGYKYLRRVSKLQITSENESFQRRLRSMLAKDPCVVVHCKCKKNPAKYISFKGGSDGIAFGGYCCADCRPKHYDYFNSVLRLNFTSLEQLRCHAERLEFLHHLRVACGLPASGPILPQRGHDVIYPPPPPQPEQLVLFA